MTMRGARRPDERQRSWNPRNHRPGRRRRSV